MYRKAIEDLVKWKAMRRRKPLIVEGVRQVGKTWLIKEFARRYYKKIAYVNFEEQIFMRGLFEEDFDISRILDAINAATHLTCSEGDTLIFFDEIQEAKNGLTSLKYFCENAPGYHVVAAGSLLGLELHKHESFPVGKVQLFTLYPMTFTEYLVAMGEEALESFLSKADWKNINLFANKYKDLLKQYYYVGGMPEAVLSFSENRDWMEVRDIQNGILASYDRDFSKHAPSDIVLRLRAVWNSLPKQLSRENRKFIYRLIREGARAREYEIALQWLFDGGLAHKVNCVSAPRIPLKSYETPEAFKIFAVDIGLLGAMCELDSETIVHGNNIFTEFKGALTEQYVAQQLRISYNLYYWSKTNSRQEVDFLVQMNGGIVPIEVKAEENLRSKSLSQFVTDFNPSKAIRLSMSDFREKSWMTNFPLYAVSMI